MAGRAWHYIFFVDIEGHQADPHVATALKEIESEATLLRILGSYAAATPRESIEATLT
jgi:chorismate mutase/prephenate dehydratase